ncbi:hypothetical protein ACHAO5_001668 [Verticillium nonalfalfae]
MNPPKKAPGRGPAPKNYMTLQEGVEIPSSIVNDKPVNKNVEDITEKNYERQLRNWDDFVEAFGPRSVDSLEDLKEYVLRLGLAMRAGLRPEQKLAAKGIKSYWKKFTAGYNRERGTIPKDHVLSVTRVHANPTYSDIQRQTTAGHVTNSIQARYYSSRNPGIDSQAAFMRTQARLMNIGEHFRNLEISWEPELWHSLPIKRREKLAMTEEYQDIEAKIRGSPTSKPERLMDIPLTEPTELEVKADIKTSPPVETKDSRLAHPIRKLRRDLENLERRELSELWEETSKKDELGHGHPLIEVYS